MEHARFSRKATLTGRRTCRFRDDKVAIIFRDELGRERHLTRADVASKVAALQQALKKQA